MRDFRSTSLPARLLRRTVRAGFRRAYRQVRLNPEEYLHHIRRVYGLPVQRWSEIRQMDEKIILLPADRIVAASARAAALEGMGLGVAGFASILPDMGILAAIIVRMLQKLSLIYGFEYSTDEELAALWLAAASAAGLDLGRDFLEKQAVERLVPRIVDRVALKFGTEVAEKWAARLVPIVSAGLAGALNYYLVRSWGRRAQKHFLARRHDIHPLAAPRFPTHSPVAIVETS